MSEYIAITLRYRQHEFELKMNGDQKIQESLEQLHNIGKLGERASAVFFYSARRGKLIPATHTFRAAGIRTGDIVEAIPLDSASLRSLQQI